MLDSLQQLLLEYISWVRALGAGGVVLYGVVYIVSTVALVPGSILTLAAGFLYGPYWAMLMVLISSVLGATIAFVLARGWLRPWVVRKFSKYPSYVRLERRIAEEGWKVVFLLRLSPLMPFSVMNYILGLSTVSLRGYVLASIFGMLPGILLYTYIGSLVSDLSQLGSTSVMPESGVSQIVFWGGLISTLAASVFLAKWARSALAEPMGKEKSIG